MIELLATKDSKRDLRIVKGYFKKIK